MYDAPEVDFGYEAFAGVGFMFEVLDHGVVFTTHR